MKNEELKIIAESLIETTERAGKKTIELYDKGLKIIKKPDDSPVTNGDLEVDKILKEKIKELTPNVPIISEESVDLKTKNNLKTYWLLDPIDGTKEYISGKDFYTLNAGLIINCLPALGIIGVPKKSRLFYSYGPSNSYEITNNIKRKLINLDKKNKNIITAVSYSNNLNSKILEFHNKFKVNTYKKVKSSLKFCLIAAGEFDLYIADPRAHEWDIAAGHAILEHAGGSVTDFNGNVIEYGKKNFINTSLILKSKNIL